ncbi:glycogen operon protein GlgX homolog [Actinoplanes sp. NBRC 14428]|uniref:Glycogen operon protein n=1 Tax=Pseudosporangium ferrugineum TaxID=439699 RepID=A0A2T0S2L2_9ACTN|nr:glycogen debranching protein GlgX [Pseudosporangium ferrugineum]PRY27661.1 glycogen operon protein [Pseudosporangium ferrugineum]BCJ55569.1 glycogen operon protein GlgX homolog [Actinoplanes sp. NBRC 14428]
MQVWPGHRYPLGATYDGTGTNFAIFSEVAEAVELCLFDASGNERKVQLHEQDAFVWHAYLPGVEPGQRYGYRVYGPYDPARGLRCNPHKLLLDPYARAVDADIDWHPSLYAYDFDNPDQMSDLDSAPHMAKGVVVNPYFDWGNDRRPDIPYHHSVIYETHVKGLTERHPEVPKDMRGTYAALGHPAVIEHFAKLGVTAVELMPVHQFVHDNRLADLGLRNYWGYNTLGFFAPYHGYSAMGSLGQQTQEFRGMVKALHAAGMEVILDVVYNHTAEGNHLGPTMSLKGIDNRTYYRLVDDQPNFYMDYTGTGNSLNVRSPQSLQLIMDSLRYWVTEMHVDGFRFDLASTLAREFYDVDRLSTFFEVVQQDPVVGQVKLIAEPWDVGPGGYQVGNFPPNWTEWNGKYRDTVRDFWRGEPATLAEFASRITGSADLYQDDGRKPFHSINFVTAHDGFTLNDLVSYNDKHNEANGEENRDGEGHNRSWNCGTEGPTDDKAVLALRAKQRRNFLATLMLSQGVPMISHGDELGRTQQGNNNAYCQDNEISWIDWDNADETLLEFTRKLTAFRHRHQVFQRRRFFTGLPVTARGGGDPLPDLEWFTPDGRQMAGDDWGNDFGRAVALFVNGEGIRERGQYGQRHVDSSFLLFFNAHDAPIEFATPPTEYGEKWEKVIETAEPSPDRPNVVEAGSTILVPDRSLIVLDRTV